MSIQTFHSTSKSTLIWNAGMSSQESAIPASLLLKLVWVFLDLCMLCIWITCKVIRTVLYVLKEKKPINQGAYETTPDHSFLHRMQCRPKSAGLDAVLFMKASDEQTWWKLVFVLLRLCVQCLFSVSMWASVPRPKGADCRMYSGEQTAPPDFTIPWTVRVWRLMWTHTNGTRDWALE